MKKDVLFFFVFLLFLTRFPVCDSQGKHPLLDITPTAVERLNYIQYHPMVLFLDPHSRKDVKALRQMYNTNSNKSSRRLYSQALKLRKHCAHLFSGTDVHVQSDTPESFFAKNYFSFFTVNCSLLSPPAARVDLQPGSHLWYETLKDKIRHQQSKPVWVSEVTVQSDALGMILTNPFLLSF